MEGYHACLCALPAMRGNTDCCKGCANNPGRDKNFWEEGKNFNIDDIKNGRMEIEYSPDGKIIKITYYN